MPFVPLGNYRGGTSVPPHVRWERVLGGTSVGRVFIIAGGTQGSIRSENYDGAGGIASATTGWSLFGDGTVFLGSGVVVAGDIYSSNWDGTIPANLASLDSGASAGYYLDSSAGAMQLEGNFWLQGDLVMSSSGEIFGDNPSTYPHFRIANFVSDDATAGAVFEFRRVSGDDYNPKIWANDDYIGIFSRWADSTAADTYQSAVIVGGNPGVGQSRVFLTNNQGYTVNSAWIELWHPKDTTKAIEIGAEANYSASELGADRAAIRLLAKGDASAVDIYGNPAAAEEILNVRQGTVGSDVKVWAVNEAGPMHKQTDLDYLPNYRYTEPTALTSFTTGAWTAVPTSTVDLWDHTGLGDNRTVVVQCWGVGRYRETAAVAYDVRLRIGISLDGGSTWNYTGSFAQGYVGTATGGGGYRENMAVQHQIAGTATGDVQIRLEYYVASSPDGLDAMHIMGQCHQYFT